MLMKNLLLPVIVLATLFLAGCGTILNGTYQKVGVSSNPSGANVAVDGKSVGSTPVIVELKRKDDHHIRIALDGYYPYEIPITCKLDVAPLVADIFFTGLLGIAVDAVSGGLYELRPDDVRAELSKEGTGAVMETGDLFVMVILTPDPSWTKIGQLERSR